MRRRDNKIVQTKRWTTESVLVKILGDENFADQKRRYPIAYEDDIKASDSWSAQKAKSQPVSNAAQE